MTTLIEAIKAGDFETFQTVLQDVIGKADCQILFASLPVAFSHHYCDRENANLLIFSELFHALLCPSNWEKSSDEIEPFALLYNAFSSTDFLDLFTYLKAPGTMSEAEYTVLEGKIESLKSKLGDNIAPCLSAMSDVAGILLEDDLGLTQSEQDQAFELRSSLDTLELSFLSGGNGLFINFGNADESDIAGENSATFVFRPAI